MAPVITKSDPQTSTVLPSPSATPNPGPRETDRASLSTPTGAPVLEGPPAQQTTRLGSGSGAEGSGSPVTGNGSNEENQSPNPPDHQIGVNEDPQQKVDPSVSLVNNADEDSGRKTSPEQSLQGNSDAGSRQGPPSGSYPSRGSDDNSGQMGQQAESNQHVDQQDSNGGLENNPTPWKAPDNTPDEQDNSLAISSQKPGQAVTIDSHIVQPLRHAISIAGTTLSPGAPPITVSGTPIMLGPSTLVVGSISVQIRLPPLSLIAGQITTLNGVMIQQLPTGISVAGTTLTPGAPPIKVSGTPISLGPSTVMIGSSSIPIALPRLPWIPGPITNIDSEVVSPLSNGIFIAGTTLIPGGPAVTVSGISMSLGSNVLVIGTSSIPLATDDPTQVITTIAGQTITANPTAVEIGSSTLTPGSPGLTLGGTLISLNPAGQLLVGSKTIPLDGAGGGSGRNAFTTTVAGQDLTADSTAVRVGSSTLIPGGPGMTLSGTLVSLDPSGRLVIGSKTVALQSSPGGSGGLIGGGFLLGGLYASSSVGPGNLASFKNDTGEGVQAFQGTAKSLQSHLVGTLIFWLICACLIRLYT